jgi:hypothetical protein
MKKILSKGEKKTLRLLVEEFFERDQAELSDRFSVDPESANTLWEHLDRALFKDSIWLDEIDAADKDQIRFPSLVLEYHSYLKPIWEQFKAGLFDFKHSVVPARKFGTALAEKNLQLPPEAMEFKDLLDEDSVLNAEQFYEIKLSVSFDSGHVTFYKRSINILLNFIDLLDGIDISHFSRCVHCGKCIFIIRSGKRYCPGCAAKKYQKEKWESDPEAMRANERVRYRKRRG